MSPDKGEGKGKSAPTSKRARPPSSPGDTAEQDSHTKMSEILISIDTKLSALDARIALVEVLHREFQALRESLEFSQEQIASLVKENTALHHSVNNITSQLSSVIKENKDMKETILDLQARSMRDNIVFSGIPENTPENPEKLITEFMISKLKIPPETANTITFHRAHRLGTKNPQNKRPRPIVAKVEHYKHKQLILSKGRELKGTNFGINDQYPREILDRRKQLLTIRKQLIQKGKRAVLSVDKLYVDGQLYRDKAITPWLF